MTWATPLIAAWAAAVAIPSLVILYFLKLRRRNVEVSTTLLWKKAIQDLQASAPFQKLRKNILLLLQLLALLAALAALGQPRIEGGASTADRHVLMIDRSASMNATDAAGEDGGAATRLEEAKRRAIEFVDGLSEGNAFAALRGGGGEEAMVIAFDTTAEVVQRFTSDKAALRAAIESIGATDVPGSIEEAFRLAQAHRPRQILSDDAGGTRDASAVEVEGLIGGPPQAFHLFTDGRLPDLDVFVPGAQDSVFYNVVGEAGTSNVAITGLRAGRAYDDPAELSVFVGLMNTAAERPTVDVELTLDGLVAAIRSVTLPAAGVPEGSGGASAARAEPGRSGVVFELTRAEGAVAEVRLRTASVTDGLPTDDAGYLVIPPAERTGVAVVTAGNLFLAEALGGLPLARLDRFSPGQLGELDTSLYDVVVLDGVLPEQIPQGRALPPGRWLVLGAVPGSPEGLVDRGEGPLTQFLDWRRDHPVLRGLTLDAVRIGPSRTVEIPATSPAVPLAETPFGPAIVELNAAETRAIVVPFDVGDSTWPFDVSFVVFLASAIDYLGSDAVAAAGGVEAQLRPGDVLADRLPAGAESARVTAPDGTETALVPAPDGRITFGPLRRVGLYEATWRGEPGPGDAIADGRPLRRYAANLLAPDESDITPATITDVSRQITEAREVDEVPRVTELWPFLLLAALAVIMLEWWVYNRKVSL